MSQTVRPASVDQSTHTATTKKSAERIDCARVCWLPKHVERIQARKSARRERREKFSFRPSQQFRPRRCWPTDTQKGAGRESKQPGQVVWQQQQQQRQQSFEWKIPRTGFSDFPGARLTCRVTLSSARTASGTTNRSTRTARRTIEAIYTPARTPCTYHPLWFEWLSHIREPNRSLAGPGLSLAKSAGSCVFVVSLSLSLRLSMRVCHTAAVRPSACQIEPTLTF